MIKTTLKFLLTFSLILLSVSNLYADTYYLKPNGNDSLDGRSDETAWRTLSKLSRITFKPGDDVYFKCGGAWKGGTIWVDWGGTASNFSIIGAYHVANGKEVHKVYGKKPIIDGNHIVPVANHPNNLDYVGLIQVSSQAYIQIENLRLINSEGHGIKINKSKYVDVRNIETKDTYRAGIIFNDSPNANSTLENNIVEKAAMVWPEYAINNGLHWPAGLVVVDSSYIKIRNNKVFDTYGEGIGSYTLDSSMPAHHNIIEDNLVYNNRAVQIYIANSSHNIIRRNIVYGTIEQEYHRDGNFNGPGLYVGDEGPNYLSSTNEFYGNMVANCSSGIVIGVGRTDAVFKNSVVYNNTIIDCNRLVTIYGSRFSNSFIRNNIFGFINLEGTNKPYDGPTTTSGLIWERNLWPEDATGSRASSTNIYGVPQLNRMSGWDKLTEGSVSAKDFALTANATNLIDKGKTLSSIYKTAVNCRLSEYPNNIVMVERPDNTWDIGADEINGETLALIEEDEPILEAPFLSILE